MPRTIHRVANATPPKPFELDSSFTVKVIQNQRIKEPEYYLGYKESHGTVFSQEVKELDMPELVKFLNQ